MTFIFKYVRWKRCPFDIAIFCISFKISFNPDPKMILREVGEYQTISWIRPDPDPSSHRLSPAHSQLLVIVSENSANRALLLTSRLFQIHIAQLESFGIQVEASGGPAYGERDPHSPAKGALAHRECRCDVVRRRPGPARQAVHGRQLQDVLQYKRGLLIDLLGGVSLIRILFL